MNVITFFREPYEILPYQRHFLMNQDRHSSECPVIFHQRLVADVWRIFLCQASRGTAFERDSQTGGAIPRRLLLREEALLRESAVKNHRPYVGRMESEIGCVSSIFR